MKPKAKLTFNLGHDANHKEIGAHIRKLIRQGFTDSEILVSTQARIDHIVGMRAAMKREESYK